MAERTIQSPHDRTRFESQPARVREYGKNERIHHEKCKRKDKVEGNIASAKDKYVEKREAEIDKWSAGLEGLEAKIKAAGVDAEAKRAHEEHINALRQKREEAKAKLAEIQAARDDKWEDLKDGMESVCEHYGRLREGQIENLIH